jgi:hypothetical protein
MWLQTNIPVAIQKMGTFFQESVVTLQGWGQGILGVLTMVWGGIQAVIDFSLTQIGLLMEAFQAASAGDWREFGRILREIFDNIIQAVSAILTNMGKFIGDMAVKAVKGIVEMAGNIVPILSKMGTDMAASLTSINWLELGMNIIMGIGQGMLNSQKWLIDMLFGVMGATLEAIKGFLGIASPSRVMSDEIGWQMGAGVSEGWEESLARMAAAMPGTVGRLAPAAASVVNAGGSRVVSAGGVNAAQGGAGMTFVVQYVDNAVISTARENEIIEKLGPAFYQFLRQQKLV